MRQLIHANIFYLRKENPPLVLEKKIKKCSVLPLLLSTLFSMSNAQPAWMWCQAGSNSPLVGWEFAELIFTFFTQSAHSLAMCKVTAGRQQAYQAPPPQSLLYTSPICRLWDSEVLCSQPSSRCLPKGNNLLSYHPADFLLY